MPTALARDIARLTDEVGDLIARGRGSGDVDLAAYADDPVGFITDVLKDRPWGTQKEIAEAVRDHPQVTVRSANSIGKDWLAARLALWWVYCRRGMVLLTAPSQRQLVRVLMQGEIARAFRRHPFPGDLYQQALILGSGEQRGILAVTSTEASRLTGFHAPKTMVILTEAQAVEDWAWEGLFACATAEDDRILAVGNPLTPTGMFFETHRSKDWKAFRISAEDHPNVKAGKTIIAGAITRRFVATMARTYGKDSPVYRARVMGEFPEHDEHTLIHPDWLEDAARRHEDVTRFVEAHLPIPDGPDPRGHPVSFGVDVARFGGDRSAVAIARGPVLGEVVTWRGSDIMETVGKVITHLKRHGFAPDSEGYRLAVDEIGIGAGAADRLKEQGWHATGVNVSTKPRDRERFLNLRAEMYWRLRDKLERGKIAIPRLPELWEELTAIRWSVNSQGKILLEPKDDTRKRLGRSPDLADAVALAFGAFDGGATIGGGHGEF